MCISSKLNRLAASCILWMCRALSLLHDKNLQIRYKKEPNCRAFNFETYRLMWVVVVFN